MRLLTTKRIRSIADVIVPKHGGKIDYAKTRKLPENNLWLPPIFWELRQATDTDGVRKIEYKTQWDRREQCDAALDELVSIFELSGSPHEHIKYYGYYGRDHTRMIIFYGKVK